MVASVVLLIRLVLLLAEIAAVPAAAPAIARVLMVESAIALTSRSPVLTLVPLTPAWVVSEMLPTLMAAPTAAVPAPATAPDRVWIFEVFSAPTEMLAAVTSPPMRSALALLLIVLQATEPCTATLPAAPAAMAPDSILAWFRASSVTSPLATSPAPFAVALVLLPISLIVSAAPTATLEPTVTAPDSEAM